MGNHSEKHTLSVDALLVKTRAAMRSAGMSESEVEDILTNKNFWNDPIFNAREFASVLEREFGVDPLSDTRFATAIESRSVLKTEELTDLLLDVEEEGEVGQPIITNVDGNIVDECTLREKLSYWLDTDKGDLDRFLSISAPWTETTFASAHLAKLTNMYLDVDVYTDARFKCAIDRPRRPSVAALKDLLEKISERTGQKIDFADFIKSTGAHQSPPAKTPRRKSLSS